MQIENPKQFLLAGKATANFTSAKTGSKLTFSIDRSKDGDVFFVTRRRALGAGFIGLINGTSHKFFRARRAHDTMMSDTFAWVWNNLDHEDLTIEHIGQCGACRRELTDPVSIARGLGPVCAEKMEL